MSNFSAAVRPMPSFVPWSAAARPAFVPLNANDPGPSPEPDAPAVIVDEDLTALREEAYDQGFAAARITMDAELAAERVAVARLAETLTNLSPEPAGPLALLLVETVDRLVRQVVGEVDIDPALLLRRVRAAAEIVSDEAKPSAIRLNPADHARLSGAELPVSMLADSTVATGSVVVETATGWIEDGIAQRLDVLRQALARID